jgi:hypothetical protein
VANVSTQGKALTQLCPVRLPIAPPWWRLSARRSGQRGGRSGHLCEKASILRTAVAFYAFVAVCVMAALVTVPVDLFHLIIP